MTCTSASKSSLTVEWDKPKLLNGEPRLYTLSWQASEDGGAANITTDVSGEHFMYDIKELRSNTKYDIEVKVSNLLQLTYRFNCNSETVASVSQMSIF